MPYICTHKKGLVAQLNSALDYGSRGCRFESCRGHESENPTVSGVFVFLSAGLLINYFPKNCKKQDKKGYFGGKNVPKVYRFFNRKLTKNARINQT